MSETTFQMGDATFRAGQPAPDTHRISLAWDWRWGGAKGAGPNVDPVRDLLALCELAPMPFSRLALSGKAIEALLEWPGSASLIHAAGGRLQIALPGYGDVALLPDDADEHDVRAMMVIQGCEDGRWSAVELARLTGAVQDEEPPDWRERLADR